MRIDTHRIFQLGGVGRCLQTGLWVPLIWINSSICLDPSPQRKMFALTFHLMSKWVSMCVSLYRLPKIRAANWINKSVSAYIRLSGHQYFMHSDKLYLYCSAIISKQRAFGYKKLQFATTHWPKFITLFYHNVLALCLLRMWTVLIIDIFNEHDSFCRLLTLAKWMLAKYDLRNIRNLPWITKQL